MNKSYLAEDFLLSSPTAIDLYEKTAKDLPILDFHNHLNPKEIYEDECFENLSAVWLGGDHYKWRAMRANGIAEDKITGGADPYEKFLAWADTVQASIGNPLYHWTGLELKRYFGIDAPLDPSTAKEIYEEASAKLKTKEYSVRNLLRRQHVQLLCTTDDPIDSLKWHQKLREDGFEIKVLPSFRPEKAVGIEKDGFADYLKTLSEVTGIECSSVRGILEALKKRLAFFVQNGCRVSDHSLESTFYVPCSEQEADAALSQRLLGQTLSETEYGKYRGYLLKELGKEYARYSMVMQLHIGALRNNSKRMFAKLGPDTGFDSIADFTYASQLCGLMNAMDLTDELPRVILYSVNSRDFDMLAAMAGNFQGNNEGIRGKVQLGSAWWFGDHIMGMERQIKTLASIGLLSPFVGMLTDSRSFLSFPRHEYFRRILCELIGQWVENGEYPAQTEAQKQYLNKLVSDISYQNAKTYFGF